MKFLLDTDVFSAITELTPNADQKKVQSWFFGLNGNDFGIPALSLYERQWGIEQLKKAGSGNAALLQNKLNQMLLAYPTAFVEIDADATLRWPAITLKIGKSNLMDAGILACASSRTLTVATRNYKHFRLNGVPLINPFKIGLDPHDGITP